MRAVLLLAALLTIGCGAHVARLRGPQSVTRIWVPLGVPDDAELCIADPVERDWSCRTVAEWRAFLHSLKNASYITLGGRP